PESHGNHHARGASRPHHHWLLSRRSRGGLMKPDPLLMSPLQQFVLVGLRTLIGWHFCYEGYVKLLHPAWLGSKNARRVDDRAKFGGCSLGAVHGPVRKGSEPAIRVEK